MLIYIVQILFIIIGDILTRNSRKQTKIYMFLVFLSMVFIAGLRNPNMGLNDYNNGYIQGWRVVCNASWKEVFSYINDTNSALKDVGFAIVCKLLSYVSKSEDFFEIVINIPYFATLCFFVNKYSMKKWISFLVLITLQYFTLSYYLLRPMWAILFVILALDKYVQNKKKWALVFILIASTMHSSAIIFLLIFIIDKLQSMKSFVWIIASSFFIGIFGNSILKFVLSVILKNNRLSYYLQTEITEGLSRFLIAILFLSLFCINYNKLVNLKEENKLFINMSMISSAFLALTPVIADFWRVALYFEIVNSVLFADLIVSQKKRDNRLIILGISTLFFVIYIFGFLFPGTNATPYIFKWGN